MNYFILHRNGLLTEHNFVEVNGQNVVGLKVSKVKQMLDLGLTSRKTEFQGYITFQHCKSRLAWKRQELLKKSGNSLTLSKSVKSEGIC